MNYDLKVSACLSGEKFLVESLRVFYHGNITPVQELYQPRKNGPNKGQPSKFGLCWLDDISPKELLGLKNILKELGVDTITINVKQKDIKAQSGLYITKELIKCAFKLNADLEIINFKNK